MKRFDWTIGLGIAVGLTAILCGAWFENLHIGFLWSPTAALIVGGGTLGAVIVRRGLAGIASALRAILSLRLINADKEEHVTERAKVAWLSRMAQKNGIKAFESYANGSNDMLILNGLVMVAESAQHEAILEGFERQADAADGTGFTESATLE